jgi:hypothetical protein
LKLQRLNRDARQAVAITCDGPLRLAEGTLAVAAGGQDRQETACRLEHYQVSRADGREPPLPQLVKLAALRLVWCLHIIIEE